MNRDEIADLLRERIRGCRECEGMLFPPVPPEGRADANIMIVGKHPDRTDFNDRRPFVGDAGRLLDKELSRIGLSREHCWLCNAVCCYGRGDSSPTKEQFESCRRFIGTQLKLVKPEIVVTLGKDATAALLGDSSPWPDYVGKAHETDSGLLVFAVTHPGQALRGASTSLYADFNSLSALVEARCPEEVENG